MSATNLSNVNERPDRICTRCGGYDLVECQATTSIWRGEKPYVIERIPALRCATCSEVLIDHKAADTLRQIGQDIPNGCETLRKIEVPVIAFPAPAV